MVSLLDTQQQLRQPLGDRDIISSPGGWQYGTTAATCVFSRLTMPPSITTRQLLTVESTT
ncbi:hypothetical protein N7530_007867 [Penicillium desertorum]|uniref:Uncharacterized protein n=1 Tax=Penicillium desertorum TaxID=1303715 RepID=A0A9X0BKD0_9EURO|nr:hypothetical protein N7530_007867 [Penicillium desertorum]